MQYQLVDTGGFNSYVFVYIWTFGNPGNDRMSLILNGRGERIRTSDPLVPNQVRYQTALRPELNAKWNADGGNAIRDPRDGSLNHNSNSTSLAEVCRP